MKSSLKSNRVGFCMYFVVAIALSFLGCVRYIEVIKEVIVEVPAEPVKLIMIPITDELIAEVATEGKTPDSYQYYISKTLFLSLDGGQRYSNINDQGQMIRIGTNIRNSIAIEAYQPGIILLPSQTGTSASSSNRLDISFEKQEGNPVIPFGKRGLGSTAKYEILYTDEIYKKINYGGIDYFVSFNDPDELPYLMITIQETVTGSSSSRGVSGLTLDQR